MASAKPELRGCLGEAMERAAAEGRRSGVHFYGDDFVAAGEEAVGQLIVPPTSMSAVHTEGHPAWEFGFLGSLSDFGANVRVISVAREAPAAGWMLL